MSVGVSCVKLAPRQNQQFIPHIRFKDWMNNDPEKRNVISKMTVFTNGFLDVIVSLFNLASQARYPK